MPNDDLPLWRLSLVGVPCMMAARFALARERKVSQGRARNRRLASGMALRLAELLRPRQHATETSKREHQEQCTQHGNRDKMWPDQVDAGAAA